MNDAPEPNGGSADKAREKRAASGAFLRSVWRTHFYAAIFAGPVLALLAITGLGILYSDTINGVTLHDLTRVEPTGKSRPLNDLHAAADAKAPKGSHLVLVNTAKEPDRAVDFQYTVDDTTYTSVYVNPYSAKVTGVHTVGDDVVGWANRLHGYIANESITVPLPALAHLVDPASGPLIQEYKVGAIIVELGAGWALVLVLSGLYLWWPRKAEKGKPLLRPRLHKGGRLKWRDIHAASGVLGAATLLIFITSGLPWSDYWGPTWSAAANKATPPAEGVALWGGSATSTLAKEGDLDRFGHRISWATREFAVPGSKQADHQHLGGIEGRTGEPGEAGRVSAGGPALMSLNDVALAASEEGLKPGYSIAMPTNITDQAGKTTYGSFALQNFWPMKIQDEKSVYLDQFTGKTLASATNAQYGALAAATELGVLTHMGTQFGLVNKIVMTAGALLILVSIVTSLAMWWKRRPERQLGLPKRPAKPQLPWALFGIGAALAVIYPLWGASLVIVLLVDWLVIHRVPALRKAFNMADKGPVSTE